MTDEIRATIGELLRALVPGAVIMGWVTWTDAQQGFLMIVGNLIVTLIFLAWKGGQGRHVLPATNAAEVIDGERAKL